MNTITCKCEHVFEVDLPELVDLDANPDYIAAIESGNFMSVTCPSCGTVIKPEFPVHIQWTSKKTSLRVIPEMDRLQFYRDQVTSTTTDADVVIGYSELAERISLVKAGLAVIAVEAIKYYLLLKAEEAAPDAEVSAWFNSISSDIIEFHIQGLRPDEVAVSRIPCSLYEKTLSDYKANPKAEPFASLRFGSYLSVQNLMRPELEDDIN